MCSNVDMKIIVFKPFIILKLTIVSIKAPGSRLKHATKLTYVLFITALPFQPTFFVTSLVDVVIDMKITIVPHFI